jgi:hypothetical protein
LPMNKISQTELIVYHLDKVKLQKLRKLSKKQDLQVDGVFSRIAICLYHGCQNLKLL